jgi:hypothetical protein
MPNRKALEKSADSSQKTQGDCHREKLNWTQHIGNELWNALQSLPFHPAGWSNIFAVKREC